MKTLLIILFAITLVACKKTRECHCNVTSKTISDSKPLKGGNTVQSTATDTYTTFSRYEKESAAQFRAEAACQSRIESSSRNYTNTVQMQDSAVVYSYTDTTVDDFNCEIK